MLHEIAHLNELFVGMLLGAEEPSHHVESSARIRQFSA